MRGSGICIALGMMVTAFSSSAQAFKSQTFDLRDPAIWQEKPVNPLAHSNSPCEVFTSSVCPAWEDEKSDIQRERERREQQRLQNEYERRWSTD